MNDLFILAVSVFYGFFISLFVLCLKTSERDISSENQIEFYQTPALVGTLVTGFTYSFMYSITNTLHGRILKVRNSNAYQQYLKECKGVSLYKGKVFYLDSKRIDKEQRRLDKAKGKMLKALKKEVGKDAELVTLYPEKVKGNICYY